MPFSLLAVGLITSFVWLVIGWIANRSVREFRHHLPVRRLWGLQDKSELGIVISDPGFSDKNEHTEFAFHPETRAAVEVESFLVRTYPGLKARLLISSNLSNEWLNKDLVVIGGPVFNPVARDLLLRLPPLARFDEYRLHLSRDGWNQEAEIDSSGVVVKDVGLVYIAQNPWNHKRRIIMLAGSRSFGTLAAARAMVRSDAIHTSRHLRKFELPIAFAVMADVRQNDVLNVRIDRTSIVNPPKH